MLIMDYYRMHGMLDSEQTRVICELHEISSYSNGPHLHNPHDTCSLFRPFGRRLCECKLG